MAQSFSRSPGPRGGGHLSVGYLDEVFVSSPNSFATEFVSVTAHFNELRMGSLPIDQFKQLAFQTVNFMFNPEYNKLFFSFTRKEGEVFLMLDQRLYDLLQLSDNWDEYSRIPVYHNGDNEIESTELINKLTAPLAAGEISVMNLGTVNTDYLMVKTDMTDKTMTILKEHLSNIKNQRTAQPPSEALSEAIQIEILPDRVTVISVNKDMINSWAFPVLRPTFFKSEQNEFFHFTQTEEDITLMADDAVFEGFPDEAAVVKMKNYRLLMIYLKEGSAQYGVLNAVCTPLAQKNISVLNVTTLTRNYLLVDNAQLDAAREALTPHFNVIGDTSLES